MSLSVKTQNLDIEVFGQTFSLHYLTDELDKIFDKYINWQDPLSIKLNEWHTRFKEQLYNFEAKKVMDLIAEMSAKILTSDLNGELLTEPQLLNDEHTWNKNQVTDLLDKTISTPFLTEHKIKEAMSHELAQEIIDWRNKLPFQLRDIFWKGLYEMILKTNEEKKQLAYRQEEAEKQLAILSELILSMELTRKTCEEQTQISIANNKSLLATQKKEFKDTAEVLTKEIKERQAINEVLAKDIVVISGQVKQLAEDNIVKNVVIANLEVKNQNLANANEHLSQQLHSRDNCGGKGGGGCTIL